MAKTYIENYNVITIWLDAAAPAAGAVATDYTAYWKTEPTTSFAYKNNI